MRRLFIPREGKDPEHKLIAIQGELELRRIAERLVLIPVRAHAPYHD